MTRIPSSASIAALLCAALAASAMSAAQAQEPAAVAPADTATESKTAPAASLPAPNPAAEKALAQRIQTIYTAFDGKSAMPDAKNFTDDFNKQVSPEQIKDVFQQMRQHVGSCHMAGQVQSPVSYATGFLLQCEKAFVPFDISIEEKAPYRIQSLLIRPGYNKK